MLVSTVSVALVVTACGNVTSREERLAARGLPVDAATEARSESAPAPRGSIETAETLPASQSITVAPRGSSVSGTPPVTAQAPSAPAERGSRPRSFAPSAPVGPVTGAAAQSPGGASPSTPSQAGEPSGPTKANPAATGPKSEIVFGSFGVESGPLGTISSAAPPAIRAWMADVNNRGGLNGHRVRIILAEDGGDPARAQSIVRQMVEKDGIMAVFYPYAIGTLVPVLPYLEEKGIPVLGQMGAETKSDYSRMVFSPITSADKGMSWAMVLGITAQTDTKKLGILYCSEVAACSLQKDGIKALLPFEGLNVAYEAQISFVQPDYTAETLAAQRAGVDVILTFADLATLARVAQSARRQNYRPVMSGVQLIQHSDTFAYADELDGIVSFSRIPTYDSPKMADYLRAMNTHQPKAPKGELGAAAYVIGRLLELRIAPLLDDDPSSAELIEALYTLKDETLGGIFPGITFPRDADRSRVNLCAIPITFKDRRFVAHDPGQTFACAPGWKPGG
jgi:branched-chain amino acid transport system substrate-binding protein